MLGETYKKLGQFQEILKKCILDRFGNNLPQDKVNLLNSTNFVIESELVHFKTGSEIQGKILRSMLQSIVDINCIKEFTLEDNTTITVPYGDDLEVEIIEFYATNIADKYKFSIDSKKDKLTLAYELMDLLGTNFDNIVLNNKADKILEIEGLELFATTYNRDILRPYGTAPVVDVIDDDKVVTHLDPTVNESTPTSEEVNILDLVSGEESNVEIPASEQKKENDSETKKDKQSILSEEKYKELCMKFARNEELTPQEFNMLLMSTPDLIDPNGNVDNQSVDLVDTSLTEEVKSRGFTISSFSTYFIIFSFLLLLLFVFMVM